MQWIRFIEGDRLNCLQMFFFLFCSLYLVFQTSQHTLPCVEHSHFIKLRFVVYLPFSILSVNVCVCDICTKCGANCILSVNFCVCDVGTIQQQCGVNQFVSLTHVPFLTILGLLRLAPINSYAHLEEL